MHYTIKHLIFSLLFSFIHLLNIYLVPSTYQILLFSGHIKISQIIPFLKGFILIVFIVINNVNI